MIVSFTSSDIFLQFVNPMKDFSLSRKETCLSSCLHIFSPTVHLCALSPLPSPCVWQFFFSHISLHHMGRFRFTLVVAAVGIRFRTWNRPGIYSLLKEGVYLMSPHPSLLRINIRCDWAALSDTSHAPSLSLFPLNSRGLITLSGQWFISLTQQQSWDLYVLPNWFFSWLILLYSYKEVCDVMENK